MRVTSLDCPHKPQEIYAAAQALTGFMQITLEQAAAQEKDNEKPEQ